MDYQFIEVNQSVIDETRSAWLRQVEESELDLPPWRFLQQLDSAEKGLHEPVAVAGLGSVSWHAVVAEENDKVACAMVEISYAQTSRDDPNSRLKLLNLRLSPDLDSATGDASSEMLHRVRDVLATLFEGILEMSGEQKPTDTLKIYCERDADAAFFEMVAVTLNSADSGVSLDVSRHGRWVLLNLQ